MCRSSPSRRLDHGALPQRDPVAAADLVAGRPVGAGELRVEGALEPGERLVGAHEADEVGRDVVGRVVADRVAPRVEALEAELLGVLDDLGGDGRRHPAGEVLEPAALLAQPRQDGEVVDVEPAGEELGDLRRLVGGQHRVADDHQPLDRAGERLAVAVEDVAAPGGQRHLTGARRGRHLGVRLGVDALQLHEPRAEHRQHHRDQHEARAAAGTAGSRAASRGVARVGWRVRTAVLPLSPGLGWRGGPRCPRPSERGRARALADDLVDDRRGVEDRRLRRQPGLEPEVVGRGGRGRLAEHRAVLEHEVRRGAARHHAHRLRLLGDPLGVAEHVELHLERLLAGRERAGLLLERGGRERRLLHRGVEEEQPDHAAEQHQADQRHERHPGRPGTATRAPPAAGPSRPRPRRSAAPGCAAGRPDCS